MGLPVLMIRSGAIPSRRRYSREMSLYGRLMSLIWSTIFRLISSGTRSSKQRFPASLWKTGIFKRLAAKAAKQLLVLAEDQHRVRAQHGKQIAGLGDYH